MKPEVSQFLKSLIKLKKKKKSQGGFDHHTMSIPTVIY